MGTLHEVRNVEESSWQYLSPRQVQILRQKGYIVREIRL